MDLSLPAIAKEIQWLWPDSFSNNKYVIMIGGRGKGGGGGHIEMAGRMVEWYWVATCNHNCWNSVAESFVKASYLVRTRHAHQVTAAAMLILQQSELNWKENINSVLKKHLLYAAAEWIVNSRMHGMRKLISFGVNSDMFVTFHNAVICSIIIFGSVCWGGNISKLGRGRLENIVKKYVMLKENHWTVLRLYTKRDCTKK